MAGRGRSIKQEPSSPRKRGRRAKTSDSSHNEKVVKQPSKKRSATVGPDTDNLRRSMRTLKIPPEDFETPNETKAPKSKRKGEQQGQGEGHDKNRFLKVIKSEKIEEEDTGMEEEHDFFTKMEHYNVDPSQCGSVNIYGGDQAELNPETGALVAVGGIVPNAIYGSQIIVANTDAPLPLMTCPQDQLLFGRYSFPDIFYSVDPNVADGVYHGLTTEMLNRTLQSVGLPRSTVWRSCVTQSNLIDNHTLLLEREMHYKERIISLTECVGKTVNIRSKVERELSKIQNKLGPLQRANKLLSGQVAELMAEKDKVSTFHKADIKASEQQGYYDRRFNDAVDTFKAQREKKVKELEATLKNIKKEFDTFVKVSNKRTQEYKKKVVEAVKNGIVVDHKLCRKEFALLKVLTMYNNDYRLDQTLAHEILLNFLQSKTGDAHSVQSLEVTNHWESLKASLSAGEFSQEKFNSLYKIIKKEKYEKEVGLKKDLVKKIKECFGETKEVDSEGEHSGEEGQHYNIQSKSLMSLDSKFDKYKSPLLPVLTAELSMPQLSKNIPSAQPVSRPSQEKVTLTRAAKTPGQTTGAKSRAKSSLTTPKRRGRPRKNAKPENDLSDPDHLENTSTFPTADKELAFHGEDGIENGIKLSDNSNSESEGFKNSRKPVRTKVKSRIIRKRNQESSLSERTDDSNSDTGLEGPSKKRGKHLFDELFGPPNPDDDKPPLLTPMTTPRSEASNILHHKYKSTTLSDSENEIDEIDTEIVKKENQENGQTVTEAKKQERNDGGEQFQVLREDLELSDESEDEKHIPVEVESPTKRKSKRKKAKGRKKSTPSKTPKKPTIAASKKIDSVEDRKGKGKQTPSRPTEVIELRRRSTRREAKIKLNLDVVPGFGISQQELLSVAKELAESAKRKKQSLTNQRTESKLGRSTVETNETSVQSSSKEVEIKKELKSPSPSKVNQNKKPDRNAQMKKLDYHIKSKLKKSQNSPSVSQSVTKAKPLQSVRDRLGDPTIPVAITAKDKSCQRSRLDDQINNAMNLREKKQNLNEDSQTTGQRKNSISRRKPQDRKISVPGNIVSSPLAILAGKEQATKLPEEGADFNIESHVSLPDCLPSSSSSLMKLAYEEDTPKPPEKNVVLKSENNFKPALKNLTPLKPVEKSCTESSSTDPIIEPHKGACSEQIITLTDSAGTKPEFPGQGAQTTLIGAVDSSRRTKRKLSPPAKVEGHDPAKRAADSTPNVSDRESGFSQVNALVPFHNNINMMGYPMGNSMGNHIGNPYGYPVPGMFNPYAQQLSPGFPGFGTNTGYMSGNFEGTESKAEATIPNESKKSLNSLNTQPDSQSPTQQQNTFTSPFGQNPNSMFPGYMNQMMFNPMYGMNPMFGNMNQMFGNQMMMQQLMMNSMNPTVNNMNPTMSNMNPTMNNMNPTMNNMNPTVSNMNPTMSNMNPTMSNMNPTMSNMNSTMNNMNPTMSNINPTMSNINPTMSNMNPTMINLNRTMNDMNPTTDTNMITETEMFKTGDVVDDTQVSDNTPRKQRKAHTLKIASPTAHKEKTGTPDKPTNQQILNRGLHSPSALNTSNQNQFGEDSMTGRSDIRNHYEYGNKEATSKLSSMNNIVRNDNESDDSSTSLMIDVGESPQMSETSDDLNSSGGSKTNIVMCAQVSQDINTKGAAKYFAEKVKREGIWNLASGKADTTKKQWRDRLIGKEQEGQIIPNSDDSGKPSSSGVQEGSLLPYETFDSPMSPCPSPSPCNNGLVPSSSNEVEQLTAEAKSTFQSLAKSLLQYDVLPKSLEELKDFRSVADRVRELKSQDSLPTSYFLARCIHHIIYDIEDEDGSYRPEGSDVPLRLTDHKMLVFIERMMNVEPQFYGDLTLKIINYCKTQVLPSSQFAMAVADSVNKLGKFYGALCRKFLSSHAEKDLLFTALYCRPSKAAAFAYGLLCSSNDAFSMLPDQFDYSKVSPCDKLMLFAMQNQLKKAPFCFELKSLLSQSLKHPSFDCTWEQIILTTLDAMKEMESDEQIQSAVKGMALLLVQGGWSLFDQFARKNFQGLTDKWADSSIPNVIFAGFLLAIGKAVVQSEEVWDLDYLRSEVEKIREKGKDLKLTEEIMDQALTDCLKSFDQKELKIKANRSKFSQRWMGSVGNVDGKRKRFRRRRKKTKQTNILT